ncbi:M14 family metallopeptidase [Planctomicrobium piriforme]|uniref:Succinylglutamate desuccinylase / Aspartoacylase family protein n=1 Tax=Planctomicrobium piriforme TaxID=1576369 RepID=A0A1I3G437_9PLAN|nr:M14 family metallopeptidase [Planctomicrobium piriforme]SFI18258.1 Succinylglutamate desuccinylase / Aspartoacylase family protein [Planctomicrobium piriforme]
MFDVLNQVPSGFLECPASGLFELLPKPTLIHLPGARPEPVFVSLLLHGNEDVGLKAVQQVLRRHAGHALPRALSLFAGNVDAARANRRRLDGQPDFNRIWPGTEEPYCPEMEMMQAIVTEMQLRQVFVSLDLHNNTGTNPHYACVCSTAEPHLRLAALFGRTVVYFTRPRGVQTMAFSNICPAITCECGKVGDASGVEHAAELVDACLHLSEFPHHAILPGDVHLFHTVATVKVPEDVTIGFGDDEADLVFSVDLDHWNFSEVGPGAEIACRRPHSDANLLVVNEKGRDVQHEYISIVGNSLRLKKRLLPSMLTLDQRVIRQDCLCYFMERYDESPHLPSAGAQVEI